LQLDSDVVPDDYVEEDKPDEKVKTTNNTSGKNNVLQTDVVPDAGEKPDEEVPITHESGETMDTDVVPDKPKVGKTTYFSLSKTQFSVWQPRCTCRHGAPAECHSTQGSLRGP